MFSMKTMQSPSRQFVPLNHVGEFTSEPSAAFPEESWRTVPWPSVKAHLPTRLPLMGTTEVEVDEVDDVEVMVCELELLEEASAGDGAGGKSSG